MYTGKIILGIIPARGGSKRLPKKNIRLFKGKPLLFHTIDQALKSKYLTEVIVSTDDKAISDLAIKHGSKVIDRPSNISQDNSKTVDALLHVLNREKANIVVCLQPTSPLRTSQDIDNAIEVFLNNKCDSVISCSVDGPNGAIYISTPKKLFKNKTFYAGKIIIYQMPVERSIDINTKKDFIKAEKLC